MGMVVLFGVVIVVGLVQLVAGYVGIEHYFGAFWAIAAVAVALLFRFMLPITVATFFGATEVWVWHWLPALLLTLPGLLFLVPAVLSGLPSLFKRQRG